MASKHRYTFDEKKASRGGRVALIFACASAACFLAAVILSFAMKGKAGVFVGAISAYAAVLSVYGFYRGMKSFSETDVSPTLSIIGSLLCGVIMVGWLTVFLTGLRR